MAKKSLNIAVFSDSAMPILNGVSVSIDVLIQELRAQGHSVHLYTSKHFGHKDSDPNIHRFNSIVTPWTPGYPISVPPFYLKLLEFRRHNFDVIHTHTPFTVGIVGLRWAQSEEIPIVSTYHTHYDKYAYYMPFFPNRYTRYKIAKHTNYYYNAVSQVITPSEASRKWLQRHSIKTPVSVIPTGIKQPKLLERAEIREKLGIRADDNVLLYVGRIAREKNLRTLIRACALAMKDDASLKLLFVGDGPQREELTKLSRTLGIGDRVRFIGFVPREDVDQYYAASDLFVFASLTETQGLVVVEAMSYGLPVVIVQGGGASDAVQTGINGELVSNNSEAMAAAIQNLIQSPDKREHYSKAAIETSKKYSIPNMTSQVIDVYRAAVDAEVSELAYA